jgi:hypothetical protein
VSRGPKKQREPKIIEDTMPPARLSPQGAVAEARARSAPLPRRVRRPSGLYRRRSSTARGPNQGYDIRDPVAPNRRDAARVLTTDLGREVSPEDARRRADRPDRRRQLAARRARPCEGRERSGAMGGSFRFGAAGFRISAWAFVGAASRPIISSRTATEAPRGGSWFRFYEADQ